VIPINVSMSMLCSGMWFYWNVSIVLKFYFCNWYWSCMCSHCLFLYGPMLKYWYRDQAISLFSSACPGKYWDHFLKYNTITSTFFPIVYYDSVIYFQVNQEIKCHCHKLVMFLLRWLDPKSPQSSAPILYFCPLVPYLLLYVFTHLGSSLVLDLTISH
jgi:hypothetical protein